MVQDWDTSNTYSWVTASGDVGGTMFGVWVRDGHHAGPDAGDDYANSGSYFVVYASMSVTTETSGEWLGDNITGLLAMVVVVAGVVFPGKRPRIVFPDRLKRLSSHA